MQKKHICIVTPCYNEEENVRALYEAVKEQFRKLPQYEYSHLFIDNASQDKTPSILEALASEDRHVKVILNARNFGHLRSPFHGMLSAPGDAVISMAADFQDPPEMIPLLLEKWEQGFLSVIAVKTKSKENPLMFLIRKVYYTIVRRISEIQSIDNYTGFGLYDRKVIESMRRLNDPYPYIRGMISEIGFEYATVAFTQPRRSRGITKNNFYTLFDLAMLGITANSKVPLRLATFFGFAMSGISMLVAIVYLIMKLIYWDTFSMGIAPAAIGVWFLGSLQLFFIGILGEYVINIYVRVANRPHVFEKKRINFEAVCEDKE
ncbi:glycosyltransferase family 2 protein [Sphaerochaeta sp.]|uniref:glycosyltransferase family 2 protein n=1 Tax=Sphaerochaeta sp. TaxID=1972642 RepID=UPI002FC8135D